MDKGWDTAWAEMPCAGRMANAAQQWGHEWGPSIPTHLPVNTTDSESSHCLEKKLDVGRGQKHQEGASREARPKKGPQVLSMENQLCCAGASRAHSALAEFTLLKNEGLAISTEINPYGNLVSDAMLCRRFLFPITLLISARKINRGEKAIGSKNI